MVGFDSGHHPASVRKRGKPIPRRRLKPRRGPVVDLKYRRFIRSFCCIVCTRGVLVRRYDAWSGTDLDSVFQMSLTEFAHVGRRGLSQKCDDRDGLPLCAEEHHRTGRYSHHKLGRRFWVFHGLDRHTLIAEAQSLYVADGGVFKTA
jgi:hypothetical protein